MKKLLFVAFAATAISACQKEMEDQKINSSENLVTFTATSDDIESKTTIWYEEGLDEGRFTTRLMTSDHVAVNGKKSTQVNKKNTIGSIVSFTVDNVTAPYYAVTATHLTFEEDGTTLKYDSEKHQYEITFSATQNYRLVNSDKTTSHHSTADILAAYSDDEDLNFRHLSTLLAININVENSTVNENIRKVYIRQGNGDYISGQWLVKYDTDNNEPYLEPVKLDNSIVYNCVTDKSTEGVSQEKVMLVAVPSYNYTNGLIITIEGMSGKSATFKMNDTDFSNKGGKIIPFKPSYTPVEPRTIKSQDDWNNFAAQYNSTGSAYPYINEGVVTLENDITVDALNPIKRKFNFIFDGNNKTITLKNATKPLFESLSGEIRNLTLDGSLDLGSTSGAPFVNTLEVGGKVYRCTNNMTVTAERKGNTYVSGLVSVMEGGVIEECTNNGTVDVIVDALTGCYNVAVAGIVADIRVTSSSAKTIDLRNCTNSSKAALTLSPKNSSHTTGGMAICGFGGIAGWLRNSASYNFENCDNSAPITLSSQYVTSENGQQGRLISVGGILGIAAPNTIGESEGELTNPGSDKYPTDYVVSLNNCDNSGHIYNCATNYSTKTQTQNKVFTGGVAGSLAGCSEESKYSSVISCSNTGTIMLYDICTGAEGLTPSKRPAYCVIAGGLIGYGAYLNMSKITVNSTIGNGYRPMVAWGGVIGCAVRTFKLDGADITIQGYFQRHVNYKNNRAVIAAVPAASNTTAMTIVPNLTGTVIKGNIVVKGGLTTSATTLADDTEAQKTDQLNLKLVANVFNTLAKVKDGCVTGQGFTPGDAVDKSAANITWSAN